MNTHKILFFLTLLLSFNQVVNADVNKKCEKNNETPVWHPAHIKNDIPVPGKYICTKINPTKWKSNITASSDKTTCVVRDKKINDAGIEYFHYRIGNKSECSKDWN